MSNSHQTRQKMRTYHRYLGFFLAGVMAVYAISGIVLVFRNTDTFKREKLIEKTLEPNLPAAALGKEIRIKNLSYTAEAGTIKSFKQGSYDAATGKVSYTVKKLPFVLDKITGLHKANTKRPLYGFNIFFGVSLLFFVVSAFWMYAPPTPVFKKGLYFTAGGIVLMLILLFV